MITTESIGPEEARQAIEAILAAVTAQDNPVAIAITDAHGELIACLRQDGAAARMVRRSRAKAYSAATLQMDTVVFRDMMKADGRTLDDWGDPRLTALQGGLAIWHQGRVVGGIAMSGNTTKRDEELAGIGRAAMKLEPTAPPAADARNDAAGEKQIIGLEAARRAVEATLARVTSSDHPIAVAVADENGELIHAVRMEGATANDMRQAERKAYTAAFMARDTSSYREQLVHDGRTLADWSDAMLTTLSGGLTIGTRRQVCGAIGVHGNAPERDEALAAIGRDAAIAATRQSPPSSATPPAPQPEVRARSSDTIAERTEVAPVLRSGGAVQAVATAVGGNGTMAQATTRKTFNLPGLAPAGAVAPDLVQVGNLFFTSAVRGVDLTTGRLGGTPEEQFTLAWRNLRSLVEGAGLSLDNVGLVTNFLDSQDYRSFINPGWLELFPTEDRPARKTTAYPLPEGEAVELQAFGVIGAQRQIIQVDGLAHRDPLPNGVRLGDYVFSSVIVPQDLVTTKMVEGPEAQTDKCFDNMRVFMEKAGGGVEDVVLQWVYLSDFNYQSYMVDVYLKAWPVVGYQAARKTFRYPMNGQIQLQVIGRIGGRRSTHEIEGHEHHDPIPLGARIGDLFASSGVSGIDPNGANHLESVEGAASQAHFGLGNVKRLVEAGGGSVADVGHMTLLVQDYADLPAIDGMWKRMFPDPNDRPARQVMKLGVQGRSRVQCHMLAVV
jgi:2-iminobutanoate/2-iminopropanoate deaminase